MSFILAFTTLNAQQPDSEILEYSSYRKVSGGKLIQTDSVCIQINTRTGDQDAQIFIPYTKSEKLSIRNAWIEDNQGQIVRKLKKDEIKDLNYISDYSLYQDDFIKSFELKHNVYPYRIRYDYEKISPYFLYILSWRPDDINGHRTPLRKAEIRVEVPKNYPIRYEQKNMKLPQVDTLKTTIVYTWQTNYFPVSTEYNALSSSYNIPEINVYPLTFMYGEEGSWTTWEDFGKWVSRLNEGLNVLPDVEKAVLNQLIAGQDDPKEKARILYQYLQENTRYINVSIDIGGFKPYPAGYVASNKYGDCKALSNYMKAMLEYAGIPSYYTLVHSGKQIRDIDRSFPSQVFNHAILTVPFATDTVFLECTMKNIPFGYYGTFLQGRDALLIKPENSVFIHIPELEPEDVLCRRNIEVNGSGNKPVTITETVRGDAFVLYNHLIHESKSVGERYLKKEMFLPSVFTLESFEFDKPDGNTPEIILHAVLEAEDPFQKYGKSLILPAFFSFIQSYESPSKRKTGVQIDYPVFSQDTVTYCVGATIGKISENIYIDTPYGYYSRSFFQKQDKLIVTKNLLIRKGCYLLEDYDRFYQFIQAIQEQESKNIYIEIQ